MLILLICLPICLHFVLILSSTTRFTTYLPIFVLILTPRTTLTTGDNGSSSSAAYACSACGAGQYQDDNNNAWNVGCKSCGAGKYHNENGQTIR